MSVKIEELKRHSALRQNDDMSKMLPDPEGRWIRMRNLPQPIDPKEHPPKDCALVICYKKGETPSIGYYFAGKREWRRIHVSEFVDTCVPMKMDPPDFYSELVVWGDPEEQRRLEAFWPHMGQPV